MTNTLTYFLYLRKSTDREDMQVLSIDGQKAACEEFANRNGFVIADTIVEHKSAKKPGRPQFAEMLARIEAGEAKGIISYHPNRLARNSKDGGDLVYWLDLGKLQDLKFPNFWFENNAQGKFMLGMEFVQSKRYSDDLSIVTKRGLLQKCAAGESPSVAPRGYLNKRDDKTIVIDPVVGPAVRQAFELYSTGRETIDSIREFLGGKGIRSHSTKRWPGGKLLTRDRIRDMLRNPFYYGSFSFAGKLYEGKHEPLISKTLFDRVQEVAQMRTHIIPPKRIPKTFTRLLRCGACGMMITAEFQKGHVYYRCTRKSSAVSCYAPFIREEELERQLSNLIQAHGLPENVTDEFHRRIDEEQKSLNQTTGEILARKRTEIGQIENQLQRLLQTYIDEFQPINRSTYLTEQNRLQSKKATLRQEIKTLESENSHWLERFRKWVNTAKTLSFIARTGSQNEKRALVFEIFGSNLRLGGKIVSGKAVKPWSSVAETDSHSGTVDLYLLARSHFLGAN